MSIEDECEGFLMTPNMNDLLVESRVFKSKSISWVSSVYSVQIFKFPLKRKKKLSLPTKNLQSGCKATNTNMNYVN